MPNKLTVLFVDDHAHVRPNRRTAILLFGKSA